MPRTVTLLILIALTASCSRYDAVRLARAAATGNPAAAAQALARDKAVGYATNPTALANDVKSFTKLVETFIKAIGGVWGDDVRIPEPKQYVKYTDNYLSRASVDFDTGQITVETLATDRPLESLRNAIVTTLLTPGDPRAVDLYSTKTVTLGDTPFLLGEVKDQEEKDIRWAWRAERFADHLIETDLKTRKVKGKTARYVSFPMVKDHLNIRAGKYRELVTAAAKRFDVSKNLIYAIMQVESDFNPFAISSAMAVGLMQVVPATAGSDVFRYLHGKQGQPSRDALFQPATNITYGTTYLHLLQTRFLGDIANPVSREYCMIAGYNGGAGSVLKTFDKDKKRAAKTINSLPPAKVYDTLRVKLPYDETKRYLGKVLEAKKQFVNFQSPQAMPIQETLTSIGQQIAELANGIYPGLPPEYLRYAGAGLLAFLALVLMIFALRLLGRPKARNSQSTRTAIPRTLQQKGIIMDVLAGPDDEIVAARCVITSARSGKIKCEIIERLDVIRTQLGNDLVCVFAPLRTRDGKVNSFTATLVESDRTGRSTNQLTLSGPTDYALIPRRKHSRKRVADQQFIRVKLWVEHPQTSDLIFEDAAPQIGVNSFVPDSMDQGANGVINISDGGIGLSVLNRLLPSTCTQDSPVVINLFMFNFREKTFKPYWYAGLVRSMEEGRPGFTRMGIEFTATAKPDPSTSRLHWIDLQNSLSERRRPLLRQGPSSLWKSTFLTDESFSRQLGHIAGTDTVPGNPTGLLFHAGQFLLQALPQAQGFIGNLVMQGLQSLELVSQLFQILRGQSFDDLVENPFTDMRQLLCFKHVPSDQGIKFPLTEGHGFVQHPAALCHAYFFAVRMSSRSCLMTFFHFSTAGRNSYSIRSAKRIQSSFSRTLPISVNRVFNSSALFKYST
eukprot:TRINITY_DN7872_c0_g1_i4.p1 TRINITY_DN7872_c0_g1~~TRINITY_DN7872_c0_g1_i4.p1  ORF type:complete len:901 (+),score=202.33 TRINITY_DN7872_c0_g1_i4:1304-4006(+)